MLPDASGFTDCAVPILVSAIANTQSEKVVFCDDHHIVIGRRCLTVRIWKCPVVNRGSLDYRSRTRGNSIGVLSTIGLPAVLDQRMRLGQN
jgi:hypothetical protein